MTNIPLVTSHVIRGRVVILLLCVTVIALPLGIVGSLSLRRSVSEASARITTQQFDSVGNSLELQLPSVAENALSVLKLIAGAFSVNPSMSFPEFVAFVSGIRGSARQLALEWVPHVIDVDRLALEATVSAYAGTNIVISQQAASGAGLVPRPAQPDYYPVAYADPLQENKGILLFDDESSPVRYAALESSRDSGQPIASEPIGLIQASGSPGSNLGVLVFMPS